MKHSNRRVVDKYYWHYDHKKTRCELIKQANMALYQHVMIENQCWYPQN